VLFFFTGPDGLPRVPVMSKRPDVIVGSADAEENVSVQVIVTGVDVRLDVCELKLWLTSRFA
jgi:hypothetical protein